MAQPSIHRAYPASIALVAMVALAGGCAAHVESTRPIESTIQRTGCLAVLPFASHTPRSEAGDFVADMVASSLVVSDRFNVVEPAEVRGLLDARGLQLTTSQAPKAARELGATLGVDAVLTGSVQVFGTKPEEPVEFSASLVDVTTGEVAWTGSVTYSSSERGVPQPVLATFAQDASDKLLDVIISRRERVGGRAACARPKAPVLEARRLQPGSAPAVSAPPPSGTQGRPTLVAALAQARETGAALESAVATDTSARSGAAETPGPAASAGAGMMASPAGSGSSPVLAGLPALPSGDSGAPGAGGSPGLADLPAMPGAGTASPGPSATDAALPPLPPMEGTAGLAALPALPDAPGGSSSPTSAGGGLSGLPALPGEATGSAGSGIPGLPSLPGEPSGGAAAGSDAGLPGLPALPGDGGGSAAGGVPGLPALPGDPGGGAGAGVPGLPPMPGGGSASSGGGLPALPDIPDLPADSGGAIEGNDLPYMPAAPERPPAVKARLTGRQRQLLRQLYTGTSLIRRLFDRTSTRMPPASKRAVADFAALMKAIPGLKLAFEVHTDAVAADPSQKMSRDQAATLQRVLESTYPFTRGRVFFRSLGNARPIAKDVTRRARVQNTRVEVRRVY